ncbi:MAG: DUF5686 and carboxypeptidase regulatory-like domain-containing protein [Duncaniella sp.]|nr:DUF5686 and carboxypeptidase regulatory-like domain-containing protein [Duncaniella sp.]
MKIRFHHILLVTILLSWLGAHAAVRPFASSRIHGVVTDSVTGEPVEFATVFLIGTGRGELTDEKGRFDIHTNLSFDSVEVSAMGYNTRRWGVIPQSDVMFSPMISPIGVSLGEVVVKPKKEKYSKRNNPAVDMMRRIRRDRDLHSPLEKENYNYRKHEAISWAYNEFQTGDSLHPSALVKQFPFLRGYVDTSEVTGKPIVNLIKRDKISDFYRRTVPSTSEKEVVLGLRNAGIDGFLDEESMQRFYEDVMREIDIYANDVTVLQNRFVSPLSAIAPDFYKFYLTDTITIDSLRCAELTFVPRNPLNKGFTGRLYVDINDSTRFINRVLLHVPRDINLNFIDAIYVTQDFARAPDSTRIKTRDDMVVEARLVPGTPSIYVRRTTDYSNHNFEPATDPSIFERLGRDITVTDVYNREDAFWTDFSSDTSDATARVDSMVMQMKRVPLYYWSEKILKILIGGYISTGSKSKFDYGPVLSTVSYNDLEGLRLRAGGMTTANLLRRLFLQGYGAYGFKDRKWKYNGVLEYSFNDKKYHRSEFPIHSLRLSHLYDVDKLGQHYLFTSPDNGILSISRISDKLITYHRVSALEYTLELRNNFSTKLKLQHERQEASRYIGFTDGYGNRHSHYNMSSATVELRFAPGEKFYQQPGGARKCINFDAPVFTLSHTVAPRGILGNRYTYNVTEASFQKRFWLSAFGAIDAKIKGGHVWSSVPFPNLLIPNANLSYTLQPESFTCLNPMEFINDSYVQWGMTYWANGVIFNYIPLLKKLKLRESIMFNGIFGHLSRRNDPSLHPELFGFPAEANVQRMRSNLPYMEAAFGVDNILNLFRVDYVWRLTYRNNPGACKGGIRFALHISL